ncbi:HAD-IIA family hydrolase [Terrabacter sp. BE26]|uniref:HAD-IIA family hydrolase n=1 Tax=Terrabacter sp. BE26 TaxID=2898152 RepID=UPI0035BE80BF
MTPGTPPQPLSAGYDGIICDLDGVVYRGAEAVPGAPRSLQELVHGGVRLVYATNNASRVPAEVARQLAALGAPATESDVVSSAQAGAARLAADLPAGTRVLALGGPGVAEALSRVGLVPVKPATVASGDRPVGGASPREGLVASDVSAVLQGFGPDLTVADFETAARLLTQGVQWVATNDDATLPLPWGQSPGNGAYVDLLAAATGRRPDVVGKPYPPLYRLALDRLGTPATRTLAVGDRLATDIAGARAAGLDSAWVLTGVDGPSDLMDTDATPTFVVASLSELQQPYAVPRREALGWRCGGASVTYSDEQLVIGHEGGAPMEVVRAGLAALVEARESGAVPDRLRHAARVLDRIVEDTRDDSCGESGDHSAADVPDEEPASKPVA